MYSQEKISSALEEYHQCHSVTKTITKLGYPSRKTLYSWVANEGNERKERQQLLQINTIEHPRCPSVELKLKVLYRCFELGESVSAVAKEIGYSKASIYNWRKKYLIGGTSALMNTRSIKLGSLKEGSPLSSIKEIEQLQIKLRNIQFEVDVLRETIKILKKDPGIDLSLLKNKEKTAIIDTLKNKYSLCALLGRLDISKSSYYYQKSLQGNKDKYMDVRNKIIDVFHNNMDCYGYRRIHAVLKREGITVSEKVIQQIMKEERLFVKNHKNKKFNSYMGEITPEVPNIIDRKFHANRPNEIWLTDITEFALPKGKVYLSIIVDCFDGYLPAWNISCSPNAKLVNDMLEQAILKLKEDEHPVVHTDRGCHYRWDGWIRRMEEAGLIRSMSKKGCSPDNSACEGVFGQLKNEMFYHRDWRNTEVSEFIEILNTYLDWYNEKRIKMTLGNMSPKEYRQIHKDI